MEGRLGSQYFLEPQETFHRRYEALRAVFVDGEPLHRVAPRSGYKVAALESMACRFRAECRRGISPPFFSRTGADDLPGRAAAKVTTDPNCRRWRTAED